MNTIKIAIADDHALFREGIRMILGELQGIELCLEAATGKALLAQLVETAPDVVLLDIEMNDINGIEVLQRVLDLSYQPKIIILSMHTEPRMVSYMMELGANGYLQKDARKEELELAIRTVYEKGTYFNEQTSSSLLAGLKTKGKKPALSVHLSAREKEVLTLICQEYTTQEIGEKLFISERTVEGHRKNLCAKLDVRNTAGLVRKAVSMNLIGDIS